MNRTELKEWFARTRRANEEALVGERPLIQEQPTPDLKQSGEHSPQEYIMQSMISKVFDAGVHVGQTSSRQEANQLGGVLEDAIGDMGLLIPPVGEKELELMNDLLTKIASGELTNYDPNTTLDYGSLEAEEDEFDRRMNIGRFDDDEDVEEDDDPIRQMGFPDYQSSLDDEDEDTEDDLSFEYKQMVAQGKRDLSKFYDK